MTQLSTIRTILIIASLTLISAVARAESATMRQMGNLRGLAFKEYIRTTRAGAGKAATLEAIFDRQGWTLSASGARIAETEPKNFRIVAVGGGATTTFELTATGPAAEVEKTTIEVTFGATETPVADEPPRGARPRARAAIAPPVAETADEEDDEKPEPAPVRARRRVAATPVPTPLPTPVFRPAPRPSPIPRRTAARPQWRRSAQETVPAYAVERRARSLKAPPVQRREVTAERAPARRARRPTSRATDSEETLSERSARVSESRPTSLVILPRLSFYKFAVQDKLDGTTGSFSSSAALGVGIRWTPIHLGKAGFFVEGGLDSVSISPAPGTSFATSSATLWGVGAGVEAAPFGESFKITVSFGLKSLLFVTTSNTNAFSVDTRSVPGGLLGLSYDFLHAGDYTFGLGVSGGVHLGSTGTVYSVNASTELAAKLQAAREYPWGDVRAGLFWVQDSADTTSALVPGTVAASQTSTAVGLELGVGLKF